MWGLNTPDGAQLPLQKRRILSESPGSGLRERKKAAVRANVLEVAHRLFHEQGFDATPIDQICSEALISKRSFFRYFRDKESLVFPNREERLSVFVSFLETNHDLPKHL